MANTNQEKLSILRRKQVEKRTGLSRSTIYLRIQDGSFPKQINLGARAVGWLEKRADIADNGGIADAEQTVQRRHLGR